ncbi:low affinity iron permease family protein [Amycolatopsis orientalis]|uniref:low affinity iron permease family protein n=1 Tax=Amycolatopsis orientalis TaxID=31958 RepID=UPI0003A8FA49|nr:low affinity iron permease family protein [Amycolatopsis orientalis]
MGTDDRPHDAVMPTDVPRQLSWFDRFATATSGYISHAWFFVACVLLVVVWAPSIFAFGTVDTWQLVINTLTSIVTFLLVALLQNTQKRADEAVQHKLNAIADGLTDLMSHVGGDDPDVDRDRRELRRAVGLEDRESSA